MPEDHVQFGNVDLWPEDQPDPLAYSEPEPPAEPTAPAAEPVAPTPAEPQPAPAASDSPPSPEGAQPEAQPGEPAPEPVTFGGRQFPNLEAAERTFREAEAARLRAATRANQVEAQLVELREQVAPLLRQAQQPQAPRIDIAALEAAGIDPSQVAAVQQLIDAQVAQRIGPVQQQFEADRQQRLRADDERSRVEAISAFRASHPDRTQDQEDAMVEVFTTLDLDPGVRENYDIAYEASQRPVLARVLRAHPDWVDTDEGMDDARLLASQHEGQAALQAQAATAAQPAQAPASPAGLLTGPSNAPQAGPNQATRDAIDDVVALDRAERGSPFTR